MPKTEVAEVSEVAESSTVEMKDEMHLDDFLNHMEAQGQHELLSAFAYEKKKVNEYKKTLDEWRADLEAFGKKKSE